MLTLIAFHFSFTCFAQTGMQTVRGTVNDKQTRTPLIGAVVSIRAEKETYYATSDTGGNFALQAPVGRCHVSASYLGYDGYSLDNLLVHSGKEAVLEILLEEKVTHLDEIVITPKVQKDAPLNKLATASARMLSTEEADRYAGSWSDPARMVSNLAGVASANDSRNDIVIRGNSPTGVQWRLDGFEIANPNHFGSIGETGGNIGMINTNQLTNSDFYTGAFPAEFGNLTSGLFDLKLRNGNSHKREYLLSMGFNGLEAGAEGRFTGSSNASYMINGRYSFLQSLHAIGLEVSGTKGAVPMYHDVSMKLNFPMKRSNLSLIALAGASKINMKDDMTDDSEWAAGDWGQEIAMRNQQFFVGASYTYRFDNNTRLENRVSAQRFSSAIDVHALSYMDSTRNRYYDTDMSESRVSYSSKLIKKINAKNSLNAGVGADMYITALADNFYPDTTPNVPLPLRSSNNTSSLLRGFFQWQHKFNDRVSLLPGVHAQLFTLNQDFSVEPRLGFQWKMTPALTLGASTGLYSQLQPFPLYFYELEGELVNKDVGMSRSWQTALSVDNKISSSWRVKTELYYQLQYNVPVIPETPEESVINFGGDYASQWSYAFENSGKGYSYGVELTVEKFFDKDWYWMLTASLYEAKYRGYDGVLRNSKFNGNFALNTLAGYEFKLAGNTLMSFNIKIAFMGNRRYTPAQSLPNKVDIVYDFPHINTLQLPSYFRADFNVNVKTSYKKFSHEYFVEIDNLTNSKNVWTQHYSITQEKYKFTYQQMLSLMGGVRLYF
ncbi:MAG: TonB-dependent receptor [Prevotellaceae bacterium]|nr:TonB-dependent receptor [Prevotellaceae bacterium]